MTGERYEEITVTRDFLSVSLLIWQRFHTHMPGLAERVFEENQGLADLGDFIPLGTVVRLPIPNRPTTPELEVVRLW